MITIRVNAFLVRVITDRLKRENAITGNPRGSRQFFLFSYCKDSGTIVGMATSGKKLAAAIGHTLAHVQDGVDFFIDWGFKALKKVGKETCVPQKDENQYLRTTKKVSRTILTFLGETGDSFYKRYQELKAKKQ